MKLQKVQQKNKQGNTRIRSGFLFLPKGNAEIRWLEYATWAERYFEIGGWRFWEWEDCKDEDFRPS